MTLVYVVAFDPGETIGWCVMGVDTINLTDVNTRELADAIHTCGAWHWGQIDTRHLGSNDAGVGVHRGHDALNFPGENLAVDQMTEILFQENAKPAVLLEKFILDPTKATGKFDLVSPIRVISAFSYALHTHYDDDVPFYLINRGDPKRTCTNERLKHWGFNSVVSHKNRHACDATRIAYYFLRDCRGNSLKARENRWRAWPYVFGDPMYQQGKTGRTPRPLGERI